MIDFEESLYQFLGFFLTKKSIIFRKKKHISIVDNMIYS